jgi:hypothetical protein
MEGIAMLKLLETFKMVYETKNFSKAAELLFISQPTVSAQIKQLEQDLDAPLFFTQWSQKRDRHAPSRVPLRKGTEFIG